MITLTTSGLWVSGAPLIHKPLFFCLDDPIIVCSDCHALAAGIYWRPCGQLSGVSGREQTKNTRFFSVFSPVFHRQLPPVGYDLPNR